MGKLRGFAENIQRPFGVKYNPYTQTVDVLSSAKRITAAVSELRGDLSIVSSALRKVSALDQDLDVEKITQMLQAGLQVSMVDQFMPFCRFKCLKFEKKK